MKAPHILATHTPYRHAELAVWDELLHVLKKYPQVWQSAEEGAMLLNKEVDELWDQVRHNQIEHARTEAIQVGAMAIRFLADVCSIDGGAVQRCRVAADEQRRIRETAGPQRTFASAHEAFGFLKREYDTLWAAVSTGTDARNAAARVAAMAVRFIAEIHTPAPPMSTPR
jgi:hypothetical protein